MGEVSDIKCPHCGSPFVKTGPFDDYTQVRGVMDDNGLIDYEAFCTFCKKPYPLEGNPYEN